MLFHFQTFYQCFNGEDNIVFINNATRFAKHRYDIKNRPKNSELAEHFHTGHNMEEDLDITIVQKDLSTT